MNFTPHSYLAKLFKDTSKLFFLETIGAVYDYTNPKIR